MPRPWYAMADVERVASPALLVHPARVRENVARMVRIAGGPARLRPHVKTHKLPQVVGMQLAAGITKFKAATIAEAEMTAAAGAPDVLLAYQPVGPNVDRLLTLAAAYPDTTFAAVADDETAIGALSKAAQASGRTVRVFLDLDCGMHRTGIEPGPRAAELYRLIASQPGLSAAGFHAYDGHLHDRDLATRTANCDAAFAPIRRLRQELEADGLAVPSIVAGGTPTFPIHAAHTDVECSPGTSLFWDWGYTTKLPDMDFLPAALVVTRVVSRPGGTRLCLDLGHKAIASENPHPRVHLFGIEDARAVGHSEEHLVIETARAAELPVGAVVYGLPVHICPTVALYSEAVVVEDGRAVDRWPIAARARRLSV
ncbi:MAG: D-TA family PLP-dependent enzyme [Acidobacteria bacterium]|nr:D-TA family PLP-dependent enzyme [Acidobacteriota bacterium]